MINKLYFLSCLLIIIIISENLIAQDYYKVKQVDEKLTPKELKIIWCTISINETKKCEGLLQANERDQIKINGETIKIECLQALNKDECMVHLDNEKATITTLDAGEMYVGGRYYSLVPIAQEILERIDNNQNLLGGLNNSYYAVAVVKSNSLIDVASLSDLKGKKACFTGVSSYAGWFLPISTLMKHGIMDITDCNNHIKSASNFFGPSCAVNCLTDRYNPIGDNSDKLCQLCVGSVPGKWCTHADPYAGYDGAFRCLIEKGEIAFLKHTTVPEMLATKEFANVPRDHFDLLCKDGSRRPLSDYANCNWGLVPSDAVVVSSAVSFEVREKYQQFLEKFVETYSPYGQRKSESPTYEENYYGNNNYHPNSNNEANRFEYEENRRQNQTYDPYEDRNNYHRYKRQSYPENSYNSFDINNNYNTRQENYDSNIPQYEHFNLFESTPKYGDHGNLLFQDTAKGLAPVPENLQTYEAFLNEAHKFIMGVRKCPVERMTLCVTSEEEKNKCARMRTALKAQLLKPELDCYKGHSQIHCMQAIRGGTADVAVLDASDVYTAGLNYDLVPFISEIYNLEDADYYVVAVAKESDPDTELTYLRTKNTCHGGINTAAGWVYPLAYLISNGWIRSYGCNSIRAAAEYFTKSCIPGAISAEYNTGVPYDNMCDLCHGASFRYCRRDASEDYYGHTGAFRCLVEGGGHVAFVKHTTVFENTGGKKRDWWVRDNLLEDFELLCPDGTRAEVNEYKRCNLGKVKSNAIVARGNYGYNKTQIDAYINLFMYAQTFYGRKVADEFSFSMFTSDPPYADLIFQDATTQLKLIPINKRFYSNYLGPDFMRARRVVDCHAHGGFIIQGTILLILICVFINVLAH